MMGVHIRIKDGYDDMGEQVFKKSRLGLCM